jgi:FtsP/CotA-like multicopper oxidase with cupredoxin domain
VVPNISFSNIQGTVTTDPPQLAEASVTSNYRPGERHSCITFNCIGGAVMENISLDSIPPAAVDWSYARFTATSYHPPEPDQVLEMMIEKRLDPQLDPRDGVNHWLMNGRSDPDIEPTFLQEGRRYRLRMMNATGQAHPVHLHHLSFELTRINQIPISGIFKDTIRLERYNVVEADVVVSHLGSPIGR